MRSKHQLDEEKKKSPADYITYEADKNEILAAFHSNFVKPIIEVVNDYLQHGTPEDEKICWLRIRERTNAEHEVLKPWLLSRFSDVDESMKVDGLPFLPREQVIAATKPNQSTKSLDEHQIQQTNELLLFSEDKSEFSYEVRNWYFLAKLYSLGESGDSRLFKKDISKESKCYKQIFKLSSLHSLPLSLIINYLWNPSSSENRYSILRHVEQLANDYTRADFWHARHYLGLFAGNGKVEAALREGVAQNETQAYLSLGNFLKNQKRKGEAYIYFAKAAKQGLSRALIDLIELLIPDQVYNRESYGLDMPGIKIAKAYAKAASERRNTAGLHYYALILAAENSAASASQALACYVESAKLGWYHERELILITNANKSNLSNSFWRKYLTNRKNRQIRQLIRSGYQWAGFLSDEQRIEAAYWAAKGVDYWSTRNTTLIHKLYVEVGDPREYFLQLAKSQKEAVHTVTANVSQDEMIACFPSNRKKDIDAFIAAIINMLANTYPLINAHLRVNDITKLTLAYLADSNYVEAAVSKCLETRPQHFRWGFWKRKENQSRREMLSSTVSKKSGPR